MRQLKLPDHACYRREEQKTWWFNKKDGERVEGRSGPTHVKSAAVDERFMQEPISDNDSIHSPERRRFGSYTPFSA